VLIFQFGGLGDLFGGAKPTTAPGGSGIVWQTSGCFLMQLTLKSA